MNEEHPLTVPNGPRFPVGPLKELVAAFTSRCMSGGLGLTCYGVPRGGKSTAALYIVQRMLESKRASIYWTALKTNKGTYKNLARSLQLSNGGKLLFASLTPEQAFLNKLLADADELGTPRVWILIDEAQNLSYDEMVGLKGAMTDMIAAGLAPFILLFAQAEILARPERFKAAGDLSLVDRFMTHTHRLRGLHRNEFEGVLAHFDTTRWPADGPTYTGHFAPAFWDQAKRMKELSPLFVTAFAEISNAAHRDPDDIPIQYLMEAATTVLMALERSSAAWGDLTSLVQQAAFATGLPGAYEFLGDIEARSRRQPAPSRLTKELA